MNQTRREILKAMLLAPVAGIVPAVSAAAVLKPVAIALPKVELQAIEYICYSVTVRQFELTFPDAVARQTMGAFLTLSGRHNLDLYRGFEPGTLRITNMQIYAKNENRDARINFELWSPCVADTNQANWLDEYYRRMRCSFAGLPNGKFVELEPDFNRIQLTNYQVPLIRDSL